MPKGKRTGTRKARASSHRTKKAGRKTMTGGMNFFGKKSYTVKTPPVIAGPTNSKKISEITVTENPNKQISPQIGISYEPNTHGKFKISGKNAERNALQKAVNNAFERRTRDYSRSRLNDYNAHVNKRFANAQSEFVNMARNAAKQPNPAEAFKKAYNNKVNREKAVEEEAKAIAEAAENARYMASMTYMLGSAETTEQRAAKQKAADEVRRKGFEEFGLAYY